MFTLAEKDRFFGRENEARELLSLVVSQRLVLFYAQSGAGKSSLIHARLVPKLQERGFVVLPVARIGAEVPKDIDRVDNVYAFNLMLSLSQGERDARSLARLELEAFLTDLAPPAGEQEVDTAKHVLIVDQFEEIFTTHIDRWADRATFFEQLDRAMMANPRLRVLLALREDYVAALDPYALLLDDHLRARYYMQRMEAPAALQAVQKPAESLRPFAKGVAEKLVENLRQVHIQEGTETKTQAGQYVEPVQLQVVCYQLWENLRHNPPGQITSDNLEAYGDVDNALSDFYNKAIKEVLSLPDSDVSELKLRLWFNNQLITEAGTRNIIDQGRENTRGMPNPVVKALAERYLLRIEPRAGGTWVELVHDRFVEPIRRANRDAEAEQRKLEAAQRQKELDDAHELAEIRAQSAAKLRRRARVLVGLSIVAVLFAIFALYALNLSNKSEADARAASADALDKAHLAATAEFSASVQRDVAQFQASMAATAVYSAKVQRDEAQRQAHIALSLKAVGSALTHMSDQPDLALLWSAAADGLEDSPDARSALFRAIQQHPYLESILRGHAGEVYTIAYSPDGKTLASGGQGITMTLWNVSNPQAPRQLGVSVPLTSTGDIASVAFSLDDRLLASGNSDGTIILWDVSNPEAPKQIGVALDAQQSGVETVAFSTDSKTLASGDDAGTIILWDVSDPRAPKQIGAPLTGHSDLVAILEFSPDGKLLASGSRDQTARLWDVSNLREAKQIGSPLGGHTDIVPSVAFSPNSKTLATASRDGSIILWDVSNPQAPKKMGNPLTKHKGTVESVVFSPDGRKLASGSGDNTIILWDVSDRYAPVPIGEPLTGHADTAWILAFSPDSKTLASGSLDTTIILWDVSSNPRPRVQLGAPLAGHTGAVWSVTYSPDDKTLASAGQDDEIILWDVSNPLSPVQLGTPLTTTGAAYHAIFSPDGKTLDTVGCGKNNANGSCTEGEIDLWDVSNPRAPVRLGAPLTTTGAVYNVGFNLNGSMLATGGCGKSNSDGSCIEGEVDLWDMSNPRAPIRLGAPLTTTGEVRSVGFNPKGSTLVIGGCGKLTNDGACVQGEIDLWNVSNPRTPVRIGEPLPGHFDLVASVAFSPDGKTLASGNQDQSIILWDVSNPAAPRRLGQLQTVYGSGVSSIALSPDGRMLAASSSDIIMLWDVSNPHTPLQIGEPLTGHTDWVQSVAFTHDSRILASGSYDGTVILWDLDPTSWRERACQLAGRSLTTDEWTQLMGDEPNTGRCEQWPLEPEATPTPMATAMP